jgi:hypothetical protein
MKIFYSITRDTRSRKLYNIFMASKNSPKKILKRDEQATSKSFGYELEGTRLQFTLRVDIKRELKAWLELMEAAKRDVIIEINKLEGKK